MRSPSVFVLTGCASGIGLETAHRLLAAGSRVVATDVEEEALRQEAARREWSQERLLLRRLDVRDAAHWEATFEAAEQRWPEGVDVLMNIAGVLRPGWTHEITPEDIDFHLDVNVRGVMLGTRVAAGRMVERGRGHIVNIASMAALAPVPGLPLYCATKYAVRGFSQAAAQELRPKGVDVTVVCPDAVATPMLELQKDYSEAALTFTAPRFLSADEVARVLTGRVLRKRPQVVVLPRRRGWLARAADTFPSLAGILAPRMTRQGLDKQRRLRSEPTP